MTQFDVIVIGSGIGGMTAALTAARLEKSVLLLEAGKQYGGFLNPFQRGQFHFDPGLHYIGDCGPEGRFTRLLANLGLEDIQFNELNPAGFDHYSFPEYQITFGKGLARFEQQLMQDFPREKDKIAAFFRLMVEVERVLPALMKIRDVPTFLKAVRHIPFYLRWGKATLKEMLDSFFVDPNLKAAISGPCGDIGLPPCKVHGLIHLNILLHYAGGGFFPKGGTKHMRDVYVRELMAHGVTMERFNAVDKIVTENKTVCGVRTEKGTEYQGRSVISNIQVDDTYAMLDERLVPKKLRRKTENLEYSLGSLCLFLGVKDTCDTSFIKDKNVWHYSSNDIDAIYADIFEGALPDGSSFFLSVPSHKDPTGSSAPDGHYAVEIVTLVSPKPFKEWASTKVMKRGEEYTRLKNQVADKIISAAERYIPGLAACVVSREISTPLSNYSFVRTPEGNIYGPAQTVSQSGRSRFPLGGPASGLFLCGASVISAGIVPCAASGFWAGKGAARYLDGCYA